MFMLLIIFLFVFAVGVTIGGLLAAPREPVRPIHFLLFALFFLIMCYIGMIVGMFLSGWISLIILEFVLAILALLFMIATVTRFHPTLGFFHPEDRILVTMLSILFFLMGLEWGLLGFRTFFTITATFVFIVALLVGLFIQQQICQILWRHSYIAFTPLIWLLFVTVLKLL
ncbi:hypothetical protein [Halalkalibacter nanhaiisediminis]|uniref:Uncharacterized protein n=1 Tax=Halalkalibacter nanhaiisediminis TaxID=688079 RepID=A0A562QM41_9BACI|nr:hypothetical protein [Halalkalibacter nanhaiisediminis]TWI57821.1 hypothetical protein IQ10_01149 [Halalkalibacter nanhaiisediminis]